MVVVERTSESWFSRIIGSIKSVLVGGFLFVVSFPLLFWNEGRAVRTAKSLEEGAGAVVSVSAERVDGGNEGKLVHLSGSATTGETLSDADFGVSANAIKLVRRVEMYQWKEQKKSETKTKLGGGTETVTTYEYKKDWDDDRIDSGSFKEAGHDNPAAMAYEGRSLVASKVTLGAFTLSAAQVDMIDKGEELRVDEKALAALPAALKWKAKVAAGSFYLGKDPASPAIGDLRIAFRAVKPQPVSIVARQVRDTFEHYQAKAGDRILLLQAGTVSADLMFKSAQEANVALTWIVRVVGFFMMFLGLTLVFRPVAVFGDVIPILGSLLGAGIGLFAFLTAGALSLFTIAVSWIFFRPLLGILLLILGVGAIGGLIALAMARKKAA